MGDVDRGVEALLNQLEVVTSSQRSGDQEVRASNEVAEVAALAIGRVALLAPEWRESLQRCASSALRRCIRSGNASNRLYKMLFWAVAAMSGLSAVASEMQSDLTSEYVVNAGLCAIMEILDELDESPEERADCDVGALLSLVLEAMRVHAQLSYVQSSGCHCVGLLVRRLSSGTTSVIAPVLAAARRFSRDLDAMCGVCRALRILCARHETLKALHDEGAADCVEGVFAEFTSPEAAPMLEEAFVVFSMLKGVDAAVEKLRQCASGSLIRPAGLKALFELGRADLRFFEGGSRGAPAMWSASCSSVGLVWWPRGSCRVIVFPNQGNISRGQNRGLQGVGALGFVTQVARV